MNAPGQVCALGGGHGLATSLRAIRTYAEEMTAVVSIADDGGSSGRIRAAAGGPAPGDLRRCFEGGELQGHALGNLLIAGLAAASGDLVAALDEMGRLVGSVGRVLPATSQPVDLVADTGDWEVEGQVSVHRAEGIVELRLSPSDVGSPPETVAAIEAADQVVLGPGSLYTSVLASVLPPDVGEALGRRSGPLVLVANLAADVEGPWAVEDQVQVLADHGVVPDMVLIDDSHDQGSTGLVVLRRATVAVLDRKSHDPLLLGKALAKCTSANM